METQTAVQETETLAPSTNDINRALINFMQILANDTNGTKTTMKGFEKQLAKAVQNGNEGDILYYQDKIVELISANIPLKEAAEKMYSAIFSDIRNLDSNWWAVNKVIGNSTTGLIWGYTWTSSDQDAFIAFINEVAKDKENTFANLAIKLRSSEENAKKYREAFIDYIEAVQKLIDPKMSQYLVDTLVQKSSYPCSEAELETLFDNLVEPKTW